MKLESIAARLLAAHDAYRDALNGDGHPGTPHDDALYFGGPIRSTVDDCSACGGAQYGAEDTLNRFWAELRVALGQPLRPYEHIYDEGATA